MSNSSGINWQNGAVLTAGELQTLDQSKPNADGGILTDPTIAGGQVSSDVTNSLVEGVLLFQALSNNAGAIAAETSRAMAAEAQLSTTLGELSGWFSNLTPSYYLYF